MKPIIVIAALAALTSTGALAQAEGEKPAASPPPAMKEEPKPAPQKDIALVQGPGQASVKEDARHCLELSTRDEIIKCAEPYLPLKMMKKM